MFLSSNFRSVNYVNSFTSTFDYDNWTLQGDAFYGSGANDVILVFDNSQYGICEFNPSVINSWNAHFDFSFENQDSTVFRLFFNSDGTFTSDVPDNGISVEYEIQAERVSVVDEVANTTIASSDVTMGTGSHTGEVDYEFGEVTVSLDGLTVTSGTIQSEPSGDSFGFSANNTALSSDEIWFESIDLEY